MKRVNILTRIEQAGILAVVRGKDKATALKSSQSVIEGGIRGIEVTFTIPKAQEVIEELVEEFAEDPRIVIGAGTVLDVVTARLAIMAGAEYIVSPSFDRETAELCNLYQIPYLPGCLTITEIQTALKAGVEIVKLFPGNAYGPSIISAIKAPFPYVNIMPTGGVNLDNMEEWLAAGAVSIGVGGSLFAPAETGDFAAVTTSAREYMDKYQEIKGEQIWEELFHSEK